MQRIPPTGVTDVAARVAHVQARIAEAAVRRGRRPEDVTLVAVTKGVNDVRVHEVVACGVRDLGENRVQEAVPKVEALGRAVRWHFIGHLQRNKVRIAVPMFAMIHSVDSGRLAAAINDAAVHPIEVLLQVSVAGEQQKHGVSPEAVPAMVTAIGKMSALRIVGLMTIAPLAADPETVRPIFRRMRELRDAARATASGAQVVALSMGMSDDFEVAIEEGATIVRIGRAIFGERH